MSRRERSLQARQNSDGKTYSVTEFRRDERGRMLSREVVAEKVLLQDADLLVKYGNRYFSLLQVVGETVKLEIQQPKGGMVPEPSIFETEGKKS